MKKTYEVRVEQLIQYAGTIEVEAESASEAVELALKEVNGTESFLLDADVEASPAYAYSVSSDRGGFSMSDARDAGLQDIRQHVACRGIESVPSQLINAAC